MRERAEAIACPWMYVGIFRPDDAEGGQLPPAMGVGVRTSAVSRRRSLWRCKVGRRKSSLLA